MKRQAKGLTQEYDRLLTEHTLLQVTHTLTTHTNRNECVSIVYNCDTQRDKQDTPTAFVPIQRQSGVLFLDGALTHLKCATYSTESSQHCGQKGPVTSDSRWFDVVSTEFSCFRILNYCMNHIAPRGIQLHCQCPLPPTRRVNTNVVTVRCAFYLMYLCGLVCQNF